MNVSHEASTTGYHRFWGVRPVAPYGRFFLASDSFSRDPTICLEVPVLKEKISKILTWRWSPWYYPIVWWNYILWFFNWDNIAREYYYLRANGWLEYRYDKPKAAGDVGESRAPIIGASVKHPPHDEKYAQQLKRIQKIDNIQQANRYLWQETDKKIDEGIEEHQRAIDGIEQRVNRLIGEIPEPEIRRLSPEGIRDPALQARMDQVARQDDIGEEESDDDSDKHAGLPDVHEDSEEEKSDEDMEGCHVHGRF